ncbi:MAG: alpha/beta hydrolase [Alphaproteobacteria bacterium]|nr:alpha/beta hydrolase [Alphaproteobacteria bacterium]MBV9370381.1 alpha/beta hydrolase [Alphaproteobacteria bacterium]MBV9901962.1 alpha/beta hydrolase [Alphaproteobacteria bacterium]
MSARRPLPARPWRRRAAAAVRRILAALLLPLASAPAAAQYAELRSQTVTLWPNGAPGSERRRGEAEVAQEYWVRNVHDPSLTVFRPAPGRANGAAIIVFPGGGHKLLVWTSEGVDFGRALTRYGLTVFVLKYRLAGEEGSSYSVEREAAADARRAVRWVRANAAGYGVDPRRVGVMGFSAGGELVTLIADNPDPPDPLAAVASRMAPDRIERQSARPDFQILLFPGPRGIPARAVAGAPPAFLAAGSLDECCAAPTVALYEQLRKAGVPAELHMYAGAGHAFNLDESDRIAILHWPDRLADWLADGGWLAPRTSPPEGTLE